MTTPLVLIALLALLIFISLLSLRNKARATMKVTKIGDLYITEDEGITTVSRIGSHSVMFDKNDLTAISYEQQHVIFIGHGTELGKIFSYIKTNDLIKLKQYFGL